MQMPTRFQRHKTETCAQCQISLNKHLGWVIILLLLWYVTPKNTWKKEEEKMGEKIHGHRQIHVCIHVFTHWDAKPYQQTQFLTAAAAGHQPATSNSLNELWQGVVLFPPPSVFCLPGTLIGSMQSNVTNWIILAPELEAADRRSRERCAQSGSYTLSGVTLLSFCSGLLWDFTPRPPRN